MKAIKYTRFKNAYPVEVVLTKELFTVRNAMKYLESRGYKPLSRSDRKLKYFYYNKEQHIEALIVNYGKEHVYKYSGLTFDLWQKREIEEKGRFNYYQYHKFKKELFKDIDAFEKYQETSYKKLAIKSELLINLF